MAIDIKRPGLLHSKLGVPQGQPIPASKLRAADKSDSPALRKEAQFAINAKKFHHGPDHSAAPLVGHWAKK